MSIALDFGAHTFRSLRREGTQAIARQSRAAYALLPDSDTPRRLLDRAGVSYAECDGNLVLIGDAAEEFARFLQVPCVNLLHGGRVPEGDPIGRQIIAILVDALLPVPGSDSEICCYTQAQLNLQARVEMSDPAALLERLIRLRGYIPQALPAGMALVLAEMVRESFTGIGLNWGAASCEISVAHCGKEVFSCSIPRGGQWIDEQIARESGLHCWDSFGNKLLDCDRSARLKEAFEPSVLSPQTRDEERIARLFQDQTQHIVREAARLFATEPRLADLPRRLHLVCGGGSTRIPGFCELLQQQLEQAQFPFAIDSIRPAADVAYGTARGCLINAELEASARLAARRKTA